MSNAPSASIALKEGKSRFSVLRTPEPATVLPNLPNLQAESAASIKPIRQTDAIFFMGVGPSLLRPNWLYFKDGRKDCSSVRVAFSVTLGIGSGHVLMCAARTSLAGTTAG